MEAEGPPGSVRFDVAPSADGDALALSADLVHTLRKQGEIATPRILRTLGILSAELALRMSRHENRFSAEKSVMHFSTLASHPDMSDDFRELQGALCVDLGCGGLNPLGSLFVLLLAGARRGVGVDLESIESPSLAAHSLYTAFSAIVTQAVKPRIPGELADYFARVRTFDLAKLANGDVTGIDHDRLTFVQETLGDSGLERGSVDILVSNSLLEHVADPEALIADAADVMRPGGLCVHSIDGVDHRWYGDPSVHRLGFLQDDSEEALVGGCNRIPPLAFGELFERNGFEVRGVREGPRVELTTADIESFAPRFRDVNADRREVLRARFYLRRR